MRNDAVAVVDTATELLKLSKEHGLPQTRAMALVYLGWAMAKMKDDAQGLRLLEEGLAGYDRLGARNNLTLAICCLSAETLLVAKQHEKAMEQVNLAISTSSQVRDRWCLPRINMIRARILQETCSNMDAAEASLREAIDVAQSQGAKGLELRAATSLARRATRARRSKRGNCWLRFMAGSLKGLRRAI